MKPLTPGERFVALAFPNPDTRRRTCKRLVRHQRAIDWTDTSALEVIGTLSRGFRDDVIDTAMRRKAKLAKQATTDGGTAE